MVLPVSMHLPNSQQIRDDHVSERDEFAVVVTRADYNAHVSWEVQRVRKVVGRPLTPG